MASLKRPRPSARWPFWLLIAAWFCANSPQAATYALLEWMAEARSFTHQQRLTLGVARVITGEKSPAPLQVARAADAPVKSPLPPVPEGAVLKKTVLSFERTLEVRPIAARSFARILPVVRVNGELRSAPPHEPPRVALAA